MRVLNYDAYVEEEIKILKNEYFKLFLFNYIYYNIIFNRSRKIQIKEIARFFNSLYFILKTDKIRKKGYYSFSDYSIHTRDGESIDDTCREIEDLIKKLCENSDYQKMFHVEDGAIIVDDGFSFSPDKAKKINNYDAPLYELKDFIYSSQKELFDRSWGESNEYSFAKEYSNGFYKTVMRSLCERAIAKSNTPLISPEREGIIISPENYEMGKLLAARFIYRCGKAWYIGNEGRLGYILRSKNVIINGLDYASKLRREIDEYRKPMNLKYLELAKRFAFLLQTCDNDEVVFDAEYSPKEYERSSRKGPDSNEAFLLARRNYILGFVNSDFQQFKVIKDKDGNVWFRDSGDDIYREFTNINTMSEERKKKVFSVKDMLDKITLEEEKKTKMRKLYDNFMLEQSDCRKRCGSLEPIFDDQTIWYRDSSKGQSGCNQGKLLVKTAKN